MLADEINRATPRTQSALLECMEERQVSVEGETRPLPRPFLVLATQNPIELEGTFPLPEAQLDRFLLRLALGYPSEADEKDVVRRFRTGSPLDELPAVDRAAGAAGHAAAGARGPRRPTQSRTTSCGWCARRGCTRRFELGASPRATPRRCTARRRRWRACTGRGYVLPDDVKRLAPAVLTHRLITSAQSRLRGRGAADVLAEIVLRRCPCPWSEAAPDSGEAEAMRGGV